MESRSDETKQIFAKSFSHNLLLREESEREKKLFKFIPFLLSFQIVFFLPDKVATYFHKLCREQFSAMANLNTEESNNALVDI